MTNESIESAGQVKKGRGRPLGTIKNPPKIKGNGRGRRPKYDLHLFKE